MHNDYEDLEQLAARAAADDGSRPPYWAPEVNEVLAGRLLYYTEGTTSKGDRQIAVVERHPDGEIISVWLSRSVLRSEFERVNPQPGDLVTVKFFGQRESKTPGGAPYFLYRVWKSSRTPVAAPTSPAPAPTSTPASAPTAATVSAPPATREVSDDDLPF